MVKQEFCSVWWWDTCIVCLPISGLGSLKRFLLWPEGLKTSHQREQSQSQDYRVGGVHCEFETNAYSTAKYAGYCISFMYVYLIDEVEWGSKWPSMKTCMDYNGCSGLSCCSYVHTETNICIPTYIWLLFKLSLLGEPMVLSAQLVNKSGFIKYTLVTLH